MTDWTTDMVAIALSRAAKTAHRLPHARVVGHFNLWPQIVRIGIERFADEPQPPRFPPTPQDIDHMIEVATWMQWIEQPDDRKLLWMRADCHPWKDIARRFGYSPRTAQRRWLTSASILAHQLSGS